MNKGLECFETLAAMATLARDYYIYKESYKMFQEDNLDRSFKLLSKCEKTAKVYYNLAVISYNQKRDHNHAIELLKNALERDPFLSIAAFALGSLLLETRNDMKGAVEAFHQAEKGMRSCTFLDYTAIGLPFVLKASDVYFNLASIYSHLDSIKSEVFLCYLRLLSMDDIRQLLIADDENPHNDNVALKIKSLNLKDKRMMFRLHRLQPEQVELRGPEFVGLIAGENYWSGFEAATVRNAKLEIAENSLAAKDSEIEGLDQTQMNDCISFVLQLEDEENHAINLILPKQETTLSILEKEIMRVVPDTEVHKIYFKEGQFEDCWIVLHDDIVLKKQIAKNSEITIKFK